MLGAGGGAGGKGSWDLPSLLIDPHGGGVFGSRGIFGSGWDRDVLGDVLGYGLRRRGYRGLLIG